MLELTEYFCARVTCVTPPGRGFSKVPAISGAGVWELSVAGILAAPGYLV